MGLFSSSTESAPPDLTKKSLRQACWDSRDKYFACLDKHDILDPRKDSTAATKCKAEDKDFNNDCIKSWVAYFKEKRVQEYQKEQQIKALEAQGAIKLDTTVRIK